MAREEVLAAWPDGVAHERSSWHWRRWHCGRSCTSKEWWARGRDAVGVRVSLVVEVNDDCWTQTLEMGLLPVWSSWAMGAMIGSDVTGKWTARLTERRESSLTE